MQHMYKLLEAAYRQPAKRTQASCPRRQAGSAHLPEGVADGLGSDVAVCPRVVHPVLLQAASSGHAASGRVRGCTTLASLQSAAGDKQPGSARSEQSAVPPPNPPPSPCPCLLVGGQRNLLQEVGHALAHRAVKAEVGAEEGHDALPGAVVQHLHRMDERERVWEGSTRCGGTRRGQAETQAGYLVVQQNNPALQPDLPACTSEKH